jgi:hypothetical protein
MRDRLVELIDEYTEPLCVRDIHQADFAEKFADHLLAEGIIVPPCKVGDMVYFADHENKSVWEGHLVSFSLDAEHLWFNCHYKCGLNIWHPIEDFGKTVFPTKSQMEEALKNEQEKL